MKKVESAKKSLRSAQNRYDSHVQIIKDLEKQISEIDTKRKEFEGEVDFYGFLQFCSQQSLFV